MQALALALALASGAPAPPAGPSPWRVVDRPALHVGVRPAAIVTRDELAAGFTVQVSANAL